MALFNDATKALFSRLLSVDVNDLMVDEAAIRAEVSPGVAGTYTWPGSMADTGNLVIKGTEAASVTDYGADPTGVADSTTAIRAAIVAAIAQGCPVFWPGGTYKVTDNLTNFWGVQDHIGPNAVIQRGANTHILEPKHTPAVIEETTLWVDAQNGVASSTRDGLFPESAFGNFLTLDVNALTSIGRRGLQGSWKVRLTGNVPFGGRWFTYQTYFTRPLIFEGDALVAGVPVTKIEYLAQGTTSIMGMWFEDNKNVLVRNLWANGFQIGFNGYGFGGKTLTRIISENCLATNCDCGFAGINSSWASWRDTTARDCDTGYRNQYCSTMTTTNCMADNCTKGYQSSRNAIGHVDYSFAQDCDIGIFIDMAARIHPMYTDFKRCGVGIHVEGAAEFINDNLTFNMGTADACTIMYESRGVAREARMYSDKTTNEFNTYTNLATYSTNAGVNTNLILLGSSYAIPAFWFRETPKKLRIVITGTMTGADTKSITFAKTDSVGAQAGTIGTFSTTAAAAFRLEINSYALTATTQRRVVTFQADSQSGRVSKTDTALTTDHDWWLRVQANSGSAASTVTIDTVELYQAG